jgi:hypothetical protein
MPIMHALCYGKSNTDSLPLPRAASVSGHCAKPIRARLSPARSLQCSEVGNPAFTVFRVVMYKDKTQ